MKVSDQTGFTLIELVVVIVILGILSAIALPRLISMETEARTAVVDSLYNSMRSSSNMVYAKAAAQGRLDDASHNIDMGDGTTINARFGYPSANSATNITNLFEELSSRVSVGGNGTTRTLEVDGRANCGVSYTESSAAGDRPEIVRDASGC